MPRRSKSRRGPVTAVPCPWCGKRNDLSLLPPEIGQTTHAKSAFKIECDHCKLSYIINNVQLTVTVARYEEQKETTENG